MVDEFFKESASNYALAIFRIGIFFIISSTISHDVFGSLASWSNLPDSARVGLPFISWFIKIVPISPSIYSTISIIGLILSIMILFGFRTRTALFLFIPVSIYLWGVPNFFGKLNHNQIMVWIPLFLLFSKCAEVLSIDSLFLKRKIGYRKSFEYAFPFKFIWISLAIIYSGSGLHKLWDTGLFWALSENLTNQIQLEWVENYDMTVGFRIDQHPVLIRVSGILILFTEILFPIFIIKPATRFISIIISWSIHLSAGYFMNIDFVHLRLISLSFFAGMKRFVVGKKNKTSVESDHSPKKSFYRRPIVILSGVIITINLALTFFEINTWPFSGYPSYSSVVPNTVSTIKFEALDFKGNHVDVKKIGKENNFRWENIRPFEIKLIEYAKGVDTAGISVRMKDYWHLWRVNNPSLNKVKEVRMIAITTSLIPEKRNIILNEFEIGILKLHYE